MSKTRICQSLTLTGLLILVSCLAIFSGQINDNDQLNSQISSDSGTANSPGFQSGSIFSHDSLAAGSEHTCAILDNQSMECWGANSFGQLGIGNTTASSTPVSVSFVNPGGITTLFPVSVSSSQYHTCAVLNDGSIQCWGAGVFNTPYYPNYGQSSVPSVSFAQVSAGGYHSCGIDTAGTVHCWGLNVVEQTSSIPAAFVAYPF